MATIYITFGQRYRYETHVSFPYADPDGYVTVKGPDYLSCRTYAYVVLEGQYADEYQDFTSLGANKWYPKGELARWRVPETWPDMKMEEAVHLVREYK